MSDQTNLRIETLDKSDVKHSFEFGEKKIKVVVRQLENNKPGFMPLYRKILSFKRAFSDFKNAQPEDIDEAQALLKQYMVVPANEQEKQAIMDMVTADEMSALFDCVLGSNTVPPVKGAA